ncbi:hypothetical protein ASE07_21255 [Noviherbaspirillum sp. Root189]|nr:hypothetical protein ASE07_21255 [Noviherbaspirillum sp. Root189]
MVPVGWAKCLMCIGICEEAGVVMERRGLPRHTGMIGTIQHIIKQCSILHNTSLDIFNTRLVNALESRTALVYLV